MKNNQDNMGINIDIRTLEDIKCNCGCTFFEQIFAMKRVPVLQSPTGREETLPIPFFVCKQCGNPFNPTNENIINKVI